MLATLLLRDNDDGDDDVELRRRLDGVRPLLLARRAVALGGATLVLATVAGPLQLPLAFVALLLAAAAAGEAEIAAVRRAADVAAVNRRLTAFAFAYASLAGLATLAAGGAEIAGVLAFVLVLAGAGQALSARPLAAVTAYSVALFTAEALAEWLGAIPPEQAPSRAAGALGSMLGTAHDGAEAAVVLLAMVALPATALLTFAITRRLQRARQAARLAATELRLTREPATQSREQDEARRDAAEGDARRKAQELEEQNRSLATINAVSFALGGRLNEEGAVAQAAALIARITGMHATQLYVAPTEGQPAEHMISAADGDAGTGGLNEELMKRVSEQSEPMFHSTAAPGEETPGQAERLPAGIDAFAVIPLVAKGRPFGAFAALGVRPQGWQQHERHLLLLVGREVAVALENAHLYRDALDRAREEALLSDVVRVVGATEDVGRAVTKALELVATRIGASHAAMLTRSPGGQLPQVIAEHRHRAGGPAASSALARALLAAPALIADRTRPLMFGEYGEASVSASLRAEGVSTLVLVPIVCADTGEVEASPGAADAVPREGGTVRQTMAGVLFVAAGPEAAWGRRHVDLLARLASVLARRLETEALLALQQQRITELSGLAEIAATVQSTIDPERLYSGFAHAVHTLVAYRRLYIAAIDDAGELSQVLRFGAGGRILRSPTPHAVDSRHPWFGQRGLERWAAGEAEPPSFIDADEQHGLVVPMRPKGQALGLIVLTTDDPPGGQLGTLITQAVEQLGLALDGASLYRQATERAARIQVLGNLAAIVASVVDLREAFDAFAEEVRWLIPFDRALMLLVDERAASVEAYATYPHTGPAGGHLGALTDSPAAVAVEAGAPVVLGRADPRYAHFDWSPFGAEAREVAAVPVVHGGAATAVFALARTRPDPYSAEELTALEEVAALLAVTIDRFRLYERAEYNARHDLLTGLPNQRYLNERLAELRVGIAEDGESALLMIDLDDLKAFNDTLGHEVGDRVLQIVADEIRQACRTDDFVARAGGDEFVVVMEDADVETATSVADRVHERLADAHMQISGAPTRVRVSIGVAIAPVSGRTFGKLLHAADQAMYEAKFAGGWRTRVAGRGEDTGLAVDFSRRPNRVVDVLVNAATAGASEGERAALALAQRYAVSVAPGLDVHGDAIAPLRMLVAGTVAARLREPRGGLDQATALLLLEGLRDEWRERDPQSVGICAPLVAVVSDLAWLQAPPPVGHGMPLDEALRRMADDAPSDATELLLLKVEEVARREAGERRQQGRAA